MRIVEVAAGVLAVGGWFGLYGVLLLVTRPRGVRPVPATQDLGPEPPAVASLVANGWELTEDAAEATLLDLGATGVLEFRQPAADAAHTTVHILQSNPTGLLPYERRVFDRVAAVAVGNVVPLTALTFRNPKQAHSWWNALRGEIIADARARGLSRRRFSATHVAILTVGAAVAATIVALASARYVFSAPGDEDPLAVVAGIGLMTFFVLTAVGGRNVGERDTPAGREAAARWLGVRAWLRAHDAFAELPPSAVAVWDRYIGYGAALGTTRVASAVIDLGMGNRRRVWSSYGGTWHRVRVSYPRFWPRYGRPIPILLLRAGLALAGGVILVRSLRPLLADFSDIDQVRRVADPVGTVGFVLGVALLAYAGYVVVRVLIDALAPLRLTGQVLWVETWRQTSGRNGSTPRPWLAYLAVDSGPSDRTTAWGLPYEMVDQCHTGDTVSMTVRRWSRRVTELTPVSAKASPSPSPSAPPSPPTSVPPSPSPSVPPSPPPSPSAPPPSASIMDSSP